MEHIIIIELPTNPHCPKAGVVEITVTEIRYQMLNEAEQPINQDAVNIAERSEAGIPTENQITADIASALNIE